MSIPSLRIVVAVTSPTGLSHLGSQSLLVSAAQTAREFSRQVGQRSPITVAFSDELSGLALSQLGRAGIDALPLICDPNNPVKLAHALVPEQNEFDLLLVHDACRPLTRVAQFHRTLEALINDVDAVRCTTAFTETLKSVDGDRIIEQTIDRTSVRRISSPEIVKTSVINFGATREEDGTGWFIPLKESARIGYVDSDPESLRINSDEELSLLESFLHWQQTVAR